MSKAIKWQIPFVSTIDKIHYRIDIYAEGYTGTPIQLTGGTNPIKTEENKSDNFFAPVRGQTGTIEVVTKLPNGGTLDINNLLPANNIDHPVRLVSISGNTETIEWQGFMSCEAYSQNYTSVPDTFSFPIISVLEAMASVQADPAMLSGLNTVGTTINQLLEIFIDKAGVSYFSEYYVPTIARGRNIVSKYIDATILFEQKEYNNENSTTYIVSGLSLQDCLARIATYMGWCLREKSGTLYFMAANETAGYNRRYRQAWIDMQGNPSYRWMVDLSNTAVSTQDIDDLDWMGNGHQRSVVQGAKSVEVVAKSDDYKLDISLPEFPNGDNVSIYQKVGQQIYGGEWWWYIVASLNITAYSHISFGYWKAKMRVYYHATSEYGDTNINEVLEHMMAGSQPTWPASLSNPKWFYSGAFYSREAFENSQQTTHSATDGIHFVFLPNTLAPNEPSQYKPNFDPSNVGYIMRIDSILPFRGAPGYFNLKSAMELVYKTQSSQFNHSSSVEADWYIGMRLQFGDQYWNGSAWQTTPCIFNALFTKNNFHSNWEDSMGIQKTDGLLVPIQPTMQGIVILEIWPQVSNLDETRDDNFILEALFTSLSVSYIPKEDQNLTDRSENHYFRLLGTNFRDEISISTDLASSLNNLPSPSLIMNDQTTPMTMLNYGSTQSPDMRRPEVDLLNRLATYYGAARQRLSLIVAHPTAAPLPLLRLKGISPDNRKYLPLAESRDWINDTSTLTCFETPNNE